MPDTINEEYEEYAAAAKTTGFADVGVAAEEFMVTPEEVCAALAEFLRSSVLDSNEYWLVVLEAIQGYQNYQRRRVEEALDLAAMHTEADLQTVHYTDRRGMPAGGHSIARGMEIHWQNGPLALFGERREPNGAFVETVIDAVIDRIEYYQGSRFHCLENAVALGHLKAAGEALAERTRARSDRGVEGTHSV